jgi:hypothetical protein
MLSGTAAQSTVTAESLAVTSRMERGTATSYCATPHCIHSASHSSSSSGPVCSSHAAASLQPPAAAAAAAAVPGRLWRGWHVRYCSTTAGTCCCTLDCYEVYSATVSRATANCCQAGCAVYQNALCAVASAVDAMLRRPYCKGEVTRITKLLHS